MKKYNLCMVLTEKCNLNCPHCYQTEKKKSLRLNDINLMLDNLAPNLDKLILTGGEVYMDKKLLYYTISNARKKISNSSILRIETNGTFFYKNETTILKEANILANLGVNEIKISRDNFHVIGGAKRYKVQKIIDALKDHNQIDIKYLSLKNAIALGNAETLDKKEKQIRKCMNGSNCNEHPHFFSDVLGNLYTCPWKIIPSFGNLIEKRLEDLTKKLKEPLQQALLIGDIWGVALNCGMPKKTIQKIKDEEGECMLCKSLFIK